jgi:hypothetical protein
MKKLFNLGQPMIAGLDRLNAVNRIGLLIVSHLEVRRVGLPISISHQAANGYS